MSDLLTHWAVFDDCRRLASRDPQMDPLLARTMHEQREFARLGAISRAGSLFVPHILESVREAWESGADNERVQRKLAFALGGITHYAADVVMKPLMSQRARADWNEAHDRMKRERGRASGEEEAVSIREVSAYYDVHVFRKVYLAGRAEPFNRFLVAANDTPTCQALEEFVRALFQRALLASHTLAPDREDLDGWLDNLLDRVQPLYVGIEYYTRAFENPDPAKLVQYGVETAFYIDDDPAIRTARAVQGGTDITDHGLAGALVEGVNRSAYGQALETGMGKLRQASAWWQGRLDCPPDLRQ